MSSETPSAAQLTASKLHQRLEECFERGTHVMSVEKDHDYAHTLFAECVASEPANLKFVEAMLRNLQAKHAGSKKKSLFGRSGSRELKKTLDRKEWSAVFRQGMEVLKDNPSDVAVLRMIAEACQQLHYNEVELAYLKQALDANPKNAEVNKHCARSLARMGQFDQAIACWHRVETIHSSDLEAARAIGELSEKKLQYPGGRPMVTERPTGPVVVATAEDQPSIDISPEILLGPRQRLERAIAGDPYDVSNYLKLADFFCEAERFNDAESTLSSGIATVGKHASLIDRLQQVQNQRAEQERADAEEQRIAQEKLQKKPLRIPWLELVLGIAGVALLFQFSPSIASATWELLDVRTWSRRTWIFANIIALLLFCAIRFSPELFRFKAKRKNVTVRRASRKT
jgi:tetratricopeptide (TPR) repeat protein